VRQAFGELLLEALRHGGELFAVGAPALGAEVVESDGARDLAEPGARRAAARVEAVPEAQCALERLAGEVVRSGLVPREPGQVAIDVVEVCLGCLRKRHLTGHTPPVDELSHLYARV